MIKRLRLFIIAIILIFFIPLILINTYFADVEALDRTEVTIKDIKLQELSFTYCKLKIFINFYNPSNQDVSDLKATFNVYVTENYVGLGSLSKVSIPAKTNEEKDLTITIYYANVAAAVADGIKKGNFDVSIKGKASGNVLFGLITVTDNFEATKPYP